MHPAAAPVIVIPEDVHVKVTAWGRPWRCYLVAATLAFHGGMVPRHEAVRVLGEPAAAERVAAGLRSLGWENAARSTTSEEP